MRLINSASSRFPMFPMHCHGFNVCSTAAAGQKSLAKLQLFLAIHLFRSVALGVGKQFGHRIRFVVFGHRSASQYCAGTLDSWVLSTYLQHLGKHRL